MTPFATLFPHTLVPPIARPVIRDKVWQRQFVAAHTRFSQPAFVRVEGLQLQAAWPTWSVEIEDVLAQTPGVYYLKPSFGSNGFGIVELTVTASGSCSLATDCPDTANYLADIPADPTQYGWDLVRAVVQRERYADRARVGIPEAHWHSSILEEALPSSRLDGALLEPRMVLQRTPMGFAVLGGFVKCITTPIAACVARDFREEPLRPILERLATVIAPHDINNFARRTETALFAASEELAPALAHELDALGVRVHQIGIDCRLCWNEKSDVTIPLLELQFGIAKLDIPLAGYRSRRELIALFGPEHD